MRRALVAGFGNVLRGDDGFGVEVVRVLERMTTLPPGTVVLEVGTGGIALPQALLTPCDLLIVVDAMVRDTATGRLHVQRIDAVEALRSVDMHMAVPSRALGLAQVLGVLPPDVFFVGCEATEIDELIMHLSPPVKQAVDDAVRAIVDLLSRETLPLGAGAATHG